MTQCVLWISILVTGSFISLSQSKLRHPSVIPKGDDDTYPLQVHVNNLHSYLLANYSTLILPRQNQSISVQVSYSQQLISLTNVNINQQSAQLFIKSFQTWTDQFLTWNASLFGGIDQISLKTTDIWMPDITYIDSPDNYVPQPEESLIKPMVFSDGTVKYSLPILKTIACDFDIIKFPYDKMLCRVKVGSWSQASNRMKMRLADNFKIETINRVHHEWQYKSGENRKSKFSFFFNKIHYEINTLVFLYTFERIPDFIFYTLIAPTLLITVLGCVAFMLPSESGEKMGFLVTIFLSLAVNLVVVTDYIPNSSENLPKLAYLFFYCMVLVGVSIFLAALVLNLHYVEPDRIRPVPKLLKIIFFNFFSDFLGCEKMSWMRAGNCCENYSVRDTEEEANEQSCMTCRKIYSCCATTCSKMGKYEKDINAIVSDTVRTLSNPCESSTDIPTQVILMEKITILLEEFAVKQQFAARAQEKVAEWKRLSRIFDRMLVYAYVFVILIIILQYYLELRLNTSWAEILDSITTYGNSSYLRETTE